MNFRRVVARLLAWVLLTEINLCKTFDHATLADPRNEDHVSLLQKGQHMLSRKPNRCALKLEKSAPIGTSCPTAKWINAMVLADPAPNKYIMDVGCNKGNDLVTWMQRFDGSKEKLWSARQWVAHYETVLGVHRWNCPVETTIKVSTARVSPKVDPAAAAQLTGVCVEPMQSNINYLRNASLQLGYANHTSSGSFHVVQSALADPAKDETIMFPFGTAGQETVGITTKVSAAAGATSHKVPITLSTVDRLAAKLGLPRVDILTVDTEGADPAVLRGANSTLSSVRYLEFEVHRDLPQTAWENTTLKSVITDLSEGGFDCYWAGESGKLLSLNKCWFDKYEKGYWGNVACAKKHDVWGRVLAEHDSECCCPVQCSGDKAIGQQCWEECHHPLQK